MNAASHLRPADDRDQHADPDREHTAGTTALWTAERIHALGAVTDLPTAAQIFGLSRAAAYDLAKRDAFPVAVLRFGTRYRVPVAAILAALHIPVTDEQLDPPPAQPT
jgi:hypothetical protein